MESRHLGGALTGKAAILAAVAQKAINISFHPKTSKSFTILA
jgi:hypothetical protein